jgi:hypothetical protein
MNIPTAGDGLITDQNIQPLIVLQVLHNSNWRQSC